MKRITAALLLPLCIQATAQSIEFKLSGVNQKKWTGVAVYNEAIKENKEVLIFHHNHTFTCDNCSIRSKHLISWRIVTNVAVNENIVVKIDEVPYQVEFSPTSTGRELMMLTKLTTDEDEPVITKTYVAE
ncbi:MAG: hypothetical protein EBZ77_00320 [Chitinophagia bacterium]|nr:hypothetical protein [Chitinophagia bacterium]